MNSLELKFFEHPSIPVGGEKFICRVDDPRITDEVRSQIRVPCIVARDLVALKRSLTYMRIAELWDEAYPYHARRTGAQG